MVATSPALSDESYVGPSSGIDYRPYLDGLRAVAVYLVVLFHAGSSWFSGGYVGVDVFFVLSGFLVTELLMRDLVGLGSIRLSRFYSRRFRRLLPAAIVTLVITAIVFSAIASPADVADAADGFRAALLYVTNWYFIDQSSEYFGADVSSNPVLHFWSLAVEEQFYLLWPLLLGGLWLIARRLGRHGWVAMRVAVAAGAVLSMAWALALRGSNPNRAYYGTDARAYQLLLGALIALTPEIGSQLLRAARWLRGAGVVAMVGLLVGASTVVELDAIERGVMIAALTGAVIVSLEVSRRGPLNSVLTLPPVVYLGRISYGTYLWHWPVVVVARSFDLSTVSTILLTLLVATALASLSFQLLERPIRLSPTLDRHRVAVIATGLVSSVAVALLVIPAVTDQRSSAEVAASELATIGFTPVPALDWEDIRTDHPSFPQCEDGPADSCTLVRGDGPHVMLIGDSHAAMMVTTFESIARREGFSFSAAVRGLCPWQRDLYVVEGIALGQRFDIDDCERFKNDLYDRIIPAIDPDIVVTMNLGSEDPKVFAQYLGPDRVAAESADILTAWLDETTTRSVDALVADGRKVVLIEPIPVGPQGPRREPLSCLSTAKVVEECRYVANQRPFSLEEVYRRLDRDSERVWAIDLDPLVCPHLPICDPIVNREVVKFDRSHLTGRFARSIAPALGDYLTANGVVQ
jgi:peptidoglycan/LPS O-acetylase OafA/YrhL